MSLVHLVPQPSKAAAPAEPAALEDHRLLLEGYLRSHVIRNHSPGTFTRERAFLEGWFQGYGVEGRPLYTWEAMRPIEGRKRITEYAFALIETGVSSDTVRRYVGILSRYFAYVLEHPFLATPEGVRHIPSIYGTIDQPVSEYDLPRHVYDGEKEGLPMDPEKLYEFFSTLRQSYLDRPGTQKSVRARNYTAAVLAGESGLRVDELIHLDIRYDLFFESKKLQTRFGKAARGSGKRPRITLFPPLARDTVSYYLRDHRPNLIQAENHHLFPSNRGEHPTYSTFYDALKEMSDVVREAGFPLAPNMSWHWFRRIFATRFIERFPGRIDVLIALLGHSTHNTVHRYIRHSTAWQDRQLIAVIEGESPSWQSNGD